MSLIKCEINAILNWSTDYVISSAAGAIICLIKDTKLYVSVVALSSEDNAKFLEQLKSGFKRITSWYKSQSKQHKDTKPKFRLPN